MSKRTVWAPMPKSQRAKIFMSFDALKGLKEAIAETEKITEPRRELSQDMIEEINRTLVSLRKGQIATVVYYGCYDEGYQQITGPIAKVDAYWKLLQIGNIAIGFDEIAELYADV